MSTITKKNILGQRLKNAPIIAKCKSVFPFIAIFSPFFLFHAYFLQYIASGTCKIIT